MKFCADCKHYTPMTSGLDYHHPQLKTPLGRPDPVDGKREGGRSQHAYVMRKERPHCTGPVCGPSGDLWEPRKPRALLCLIAVACVFACIAWSMWRMTR